MYIFLLLIFVFIAKKQQNYKINPITLIKTTGKINLKFALNIIQLHVVN